MSDSKGPLVVSAELAEKLLAVLNVVIERPHSFCRECADNGFGVGKDCPNRGFPCDLLDIRNALANAAPMVVPVEVQALVASTRETLKGLEDCAQKCKATLEKIPYAGTLIAQNAIGRAVQNSDNVVTIAVDQHERLESCRRQLEVIAVGDSENPMDDARNLLVASGFWNGVTANKETSAQIVTRFGCYCDLEPQMEPDSCVIDDGRPHDCIYAKGKACKTQCEHWKPITRENNIKAGISPDAGLNVKNREIST